MIVRVVLVVDGSQLDKGAGNIAVQKALQA
jgi:hypothetical protein